MGTFLDVEGASRAANRLESAAKEATAAADRLEQVVREIRVLTDHGYGNNVSTLIELLQKAEQQRSDEVERLNEVLASVDASTDLETARRRAFQGRSGNQQERK